MKSNLNPLKKIILFCFALFSITKSSSQTTYTFTSGGATGTTIPSQSLLNTTYSNTSLSGLVTVFLGIQTWTVPGTGLYRIATYGAKGGSGSIAGGYGAKMQGDFNLTGGQILKILVGQPGDNGYYQGGGGGGSYVSTSSNTALCVAGGGGGGYYSSYFTGSSSMSGTVSTTGNSGYNGYSGVVNALGGSSGAGGYISTFNTNSQASAGGGFTGNGANGYYTTGGTAFINGGAGGLTYASSGYAGNGGFGGGGGADWYYYTGAGGGGGYSGGGAGFNYGCGGGGGSYNSGSNQSNASGFNSGNGMVVITRLSGVSISQTASVTCNGLANAALTASGFGVTAPYGYVWSTGSTSSVVSGLGAGTYTCTLTDASSAVYTNTFTITEPAVLSSSIISQTNLICNGASNGQLVVTGYGGTTPYTYSWSPSGGTSATSTGLSAGTYISYLRDANNCLSAQIATITQPGPITVLGFATSGTVCSGQTSILIGAGALTYTWTNGVTNGVSFVPSATTVYTLTGTNGSGCNGTATAAIVVNPLPSLSISGSSILCIGSSATLYVSGANTYTWNTSSTSSGISITPLTTTSYTVSGTNSNGCDNTTVKTVTVLNTAPAVIANASSSSVCTGNTTTLFGSGATTYAWTGGVTDNSAFSPGASGTYTVTGFNACGSGTNSIFITVNSLPLITASASNTSICIGNTTILNGGGGVSYSWSGSITNNSAFAPSSTATYIVTGTDANGCQNSASKTIVVNPLPAIAAHVTNSVVCLGNPTTFFGSGGVSYSWTGGITDNSSFTPGVSASYVVTGTDSNGCQNTASESVTVIYVPALTASPSNPAVCLGNSTSLSASGALSYTWSNGMANGGSFSPTSTNTYTVFGSNTCGTTSTAVSVTVNPLPNVTANASNTVACYGTAITLFGGGASTYNWTGGITNNSAFQPTITSSYTVTGTDVNGCQNTASKTLTVLSLPVVTASASSSSFCSGNSTTLNGGGASTYVWSGGVTNNSPFTPTLTAAYTVTGTATNGCQNTAVKTITVYTSPTVFANVSNSVICNSNSTSFFGSGANTYTWSGNITNGAILFPTVTTTYSVSGTNTLTGCTSTNLAFATVTVNALPSLTITASSLSVCLGQTVSLTASGATSYTWSSTTVQNGIPFTPTATTGYFVTGKNTTTGCSNIAYQTITGIAPPTVTATVSSTLICAGSSVIFTGLGADTYTWNGGITNGVPFVPSNAIYYVTGTNTLTGCTSTNYATQFVSLNPSPNLIINISHTAVCQGFTTSINSLGANTYSWSNNVIEGLAFSPSVTATYTVVGTNTLSGCASTATRTIVVNPLPVVTVGSSVSAVCMGSLITLSGSGASTYTWTGGILNGVPFSPTITTTYSVIGKSSLTGCTSANSASQLVTVNPLPIVSSSVSTAAVCKGSAVIFTGNGADTYTWTNGPTDGVPFTPLQADSYSVSGTNTLTGCTSTNISVQNIAINPLPLLSVSVADSMICSGETTTLTVGSTASYTWSTGETSSSILVSPSVTTTYSATVKNSNNCFNSQSVTVDVSDCTSLNSYSSVSGLLIYPNPNNGTFVIKGESELTLQIINELGQVVNSLTLNENNSHEISVQNLPAGIYFAIGRAGNKQIKQKIVIAK